MWQAPSVEEMQAMLPQYEVLEILGRGGMGAVYKARQVSLNRVVALKLLAAHSAHEGGLDFAVRFKVEAQAMARLAHPHIVAVHDFGETGAGRFFYAMEFVEGEDLARRIERERKLPPEEARRIALAVCDALICAHAQGVVHRDIKPSNILLGVNGLVKVADFGLAKIDDPATATLTLSGTTMGSQGYAAPEVFAKASTADHRADIYSLGVLIYEMLTGEVPRGLFKMPSQKVPGLDERWDAIICKAVEEDREERFQSVAEMRAELERVAETGAFRYVSAAAALVIVAAGLWIALSKRAPLAATQTSSGVTDAWMDVMAKLDPARDSIGGQWVILNGALSNQNESSNSLIKLPVRPAGDYAMRLRLTRLSDTGGYAVIAFRFKEHAAALVIDDSPKPSVGLASIDDKPMAVNGSGVTRTAPFLPVGETCDLLLLVNDKGMTLNSNGAEIFRWSGDWSRVSQRGPGVLNAFGGAAGMGIGCYMGRIGIHSIELRETGRQDFAEDATAGWQDVLAQIDLTKHRRAGRWKMVDGKLANEDSVSGSVVELPVTAPGASDLRIKMTRLTPGSGSVTLAFQIGDRGGQFVFMDYSRPRAGLEYIDGKSISNNGVQVEHPAAYLSIGHPHEIWLRLREEGMTASLDGLEIYRWKGDWARVTREGSWLPEALMGRNVFAISSRVGRIEMEEIAFRDVTGADAKTLPKGAPGAPPLPAPQVFAGNGHRYRFVPGQFTWSEAEANAKSMGGHLATLTTQEEHDWVWQTFSPWLPSQLASSARSRGWWIGGMLTPEKEWKWVTDEPFDFNRADKNEKTDARVPRLLQHDNGGGQHSLWRTVHYSLHFGYLVEWDVPDTLTTGSETEAKQFVAWLMTLPASAEPSHSEHKVPDFMIEGSARNLRKVTDLPDGPFTITRVRIGPLTVDDTARKHLTMLAHLTRLYDLRIYAADDAEALGCVRDLTRLGTLVFKATPDKNLRLTDAQLESLAELVNLNSLRLEGWSGMTGSGLAAMKNKRKLSALGINDCPDFDDTGLAEVARFTGLESLSLSGAAKITDAGLLQLKILKHLKSLDLTGCHVSAAAAAELQSALPDCVVTR
jgi:serine/threonine protein kinase